MNALERLAVKKAQVSNLPVFARLCDLPDLVVVHRENDKRYVLVGNTLRPLKLVMGKQAA